MTFEPMPRRVLYACGALLLGGQLMTASPAVALEILVYNLTQAPIDKIYARPIDPSTQDEQYASFRVDAGSIAPGGSMRLQITDAFCQFDLLVTFQGTSLLAERTDTDLCWHPIVEVWSDGIAVQ